MPSGFRFREIEATDIPALFDVRIATWHNPHGRDELTAMGITPATVADMLGDTHRGWLCEYEDRVIGFSIGNRTNGEMWVIAVLPRYEGLGIGRRLLTYVEEWLFGTGWTEIWLTTDHDETLRAVGFYRHLGWQDWKLEPDGDRFLRKTRPSPRD